MQHRHEARGRVVGAQVEPLDQWPNPQLHRPCDRASGRGGRRGRRRATGDRQQKRCNEAAGVHDRNIGRAPALSGGESTRAGAEKCVVSRPMLALLAALAALPPDTAYWQQHVDYRITAALDEPSGVLTGHARIIYVNHSPDTLRDFYVHQYLNAFRPGSRWSAVDSAEERDRFQHLKDPDYAFERIKSATLMGESRVPDYPYATDSTVAHWTLPLALASCH